jgi:4-aminobutyrate aminotransferase
VACAAALATLDVIEEEGLVENARVRGAELQDKLRKVAADNPVIGDVRGLGLMLGCEFSTREGRPDPATALAAQRAAADRGLLLLTCGAWNQVVRMIPALVVNAEQIDEAVNIWDDAVRASQEA